MMEAYAEIARIDARVRDKLVKRARRQGMTKQGEIIKLIEEWKRVAMRSDRHRKHRPHKER
jgi:hypothetical protein